MIFIWSNANRYAISYQHGADRLENVDTALRMILASPVVVLPCFSHAMNAVKTQPVQLDAWRDLSISTDGSLVA